MPRHRRRRKEPSKPMNIKSMIAVGFLGFCGCVTLFLLWYYYPYHQLQFFVEKTDIDQEHYSQKLMNMNLHPKYTHWIRRHNKNNESLNNISSINNNYNPLNIDTQNKDEFIEINIQNTNNKDELRNIFLKYLEPLCIKKNILSHDYLNKPLPTDCKDLLDSMINISTHHLFNDNEINALSQRIEYLTDIIPQNGAYLFIHIPHTALQSIIVHIINENFKENQILHVDDDEVTNKPVNIDNAYMQNIKVVYGHLPYGFDKIFISDMNDKENTKKYVLSIEELEDIENGNDEHGKFKDLWINKLNFTYYTVVREPIDFVIANYYDNDNKEKYADLDEFFEHKLNRNIMTKYLCGSDINTWYNLDEYRNKYKTKNMDNVLVNGNDYIMARNNLLSMGWIGLFENLLSSVNELKYFWKLENANKIKMKTEINKNFDKPSNIRLTLSQHETILKRNKWDVMLYELALVLQKQQEIVVKYKS